MKTFAVVVALAGAVSARDILREKMAEKQIKLQQAEMEEPTSEVVFDMEPDTADAEVVIDRIQARWELMSNINFYAKNVWLGMHQGFYGMSMHANKPTEDCFGSWIPETVHEISTFGDTLTHNFMGLEYDVVETAAYDVLDLVFKNDEYCHFRQTFWDIYSFCRVEGNCTDILQNVQTNAFSMVTQVSSALAIFKQQKWSDMDVEGRAYALNQLGHASTQLVTDLLGFHLQ